MPFVIGKSKSKKGDHLCYLCLITFPSGILGQVWYFIVSIPDPCCLSYFMFITFLAFVIAALWSPAGKGLTSWLLFVMSNCDFLTFPCSLAEFGRILGGPGT